MAQRMKQFTPLVVTTKFFNYSLPLNLDSYRSCSFKCEYCFMKNRVIGARDETLQPNINWLRNKFQKVYDDKDVNKENFLEMLLHNRITLAMGTKSECFQPAEAIHHNTREIVDLCKQYDQKIVFTTKADGVFDVGIDPSCHSFMMSVTNHYDDRYLEPNVPSFESRVQFYNELKNEGFKVGIRFEPFIPNVTDVGKILQYFDDADHIHLSRLRLLPQIDNSQLLKHIRCSSKDFGTNGLTSLRSDVWYVYAKPIIDFLEDNGYSYTTSFAEFGNNDCSPYGDKLVWKATTFDTLHLRRKYGENWTLEDGLKEIGIYKDCNCASLFCSNRRGG